MQRSFTLRHVWSEVSPDSPEQCVPGGAVRRHDSIKTKKPLEDQRKVGYITYISLAHQRVSEELRRSSQRIIDFDIEESGKADM
jgi:hypothetical protein